MGEIKIVDLVGKGFLPEKKIFGLNKLLYREKSAFQVDYFSFNPSPDVLNKVSKENSFRIREVMGGDFEIQVYKILFGHLAKRRGVKNFDFEKYLFSASDLASKVGDFENLPVWKVNEKLNEIFKGGSYQGYPQSFYLETNAIMSVFRDSTLEVKYFPEIYEEVRLYKQYWEGKEKDFDFRTFNSKILDEYNAFIQESP